MFFKSSEISQKCIYKSRGLVDERLVGKDQNGYSLEHALVADTSRSLIQELIDFAKEQRIRKEKRFRALDCIQDIDGITAQDIHSLVKKDIDCKATHDMSDCKERQIIDYKDLDYFQ